MRKSWEPMSKLCQSRKITEKKKKDNRALNNKKIKTLRNNKSTEPQVWNGLGELLVKEVESQRKRKERKGSTIEAIVLTVCGNSFGFVGKIIINILTKEDLEVTLLRGNLWALGRLKTTFWKRSVQQQADRSISVDCSSFDQTQGRIYPLCKCQLENHCERGKEKAMVKNLLLNKATWTVHLF